ncbi:hypothetical protein P4M26_12635 [Pseudomonas aeruginosa]|nr:hypothetical protein [Pseudomonas aeruginosa]
MRSWHGVVTKIAKQGKGAVVKNRLGPEELLVPFTVSTLVEVDLDARIYGTDVDDTPWAEGDERKEVLVGTEVELLTDTDTFPTHASQVLSANFRFALDIVKGGLSGPVRKGAVLVIYHDFQQEIRRGDSGSAFAEAVVAYARNKLYKPAFAIKADTNYAQLVRDLGKVAAESGEQYFIDTILIATHGTAGQLWLGNPHGDSTADVMARRVQGKQFVEPQAFGATLLELFGKELAIALYGCDFAGDEDGEAAALELRIAANASGLRRQGHGVSQCQQRGSFHGDLQQGDGGLPDRQDRGTGWKPGTGIRYLRPRPALSLPIAQDLRPQTLRLAPGLFPGESLKIGSPHWGGPSLPAGGFSGCFQTAWWVAARGAFVCGERAGVSGSAWWPGCRYWQA